MWAGGRSEPIDRGYVGRGQVRDSRQGVCGQGVETIDMDSVAREVVGRGQVRDSMGRGYVGRGQVETVDRGYVGRGQVRDSRQGVCGQGVGQRQ